MRLLYLTRGCNIHDRRFLRAFVKHGVATAFLSLENCDASVSQFPLPDGVSNLGQLGLPSAASTTSLDSALGSFKRLVSVFNPDLILAGPVHDSGYLLARAGLPVPWVVQSWAFDVFWEAFQQPEAAERSRVALQAAPALFADCAAVVRRCKQLAGIELREHFTIPWGIELEALRRPWQRDALRRELGAEERIVFLCTRGMEPVYGVETLLQAFRRAHRDNPNILLLWPADGSLRAAVAAFAAKHELTNAIRLPGAVIHERVLEMFAAADAYVSCAESDGSSISLLEAMWFGIPVIVSDVGGNPEWVNSHANGWLNPVGSVESVGAALLEVGCMTDKFRRQYGALSRQTILQRADFSHNIRQFLRWLKSLASRGLTVSHHPSMRHCG